MGSSTKRVLLTVGLLTGAVVVALPIVRETEHYDLDDAFRAKASGDFVELEHGKVHYELAGSGPGPVVVLIHGYSTPSFVWDPTFDALVRQGFRVLRYDHFGRGFSDRPDLTYDRTVYERQLIGLLDALGLHEPVDLVGLSMGGAVAACVTASFPQRVRRLVLVDPFIGPVQGAWPVTMPVIGGYVARVMYSPTQTERQDDGYHRPERADPTHKARFAEQMSYRGFRRALLRTLKHFMGDDLAPIYAEAGSRGKPTLLIWGRQDQTVPFAEHQRILEPLGAKLFAVDDAGHLPHLEQPAAVEPELVAFLGIE